MTKEIALYCMKAYSEHYSEMCEECPIYGQTGDDHCFEDALQYVINHFDVLDKIRAEISEYKDDKIIHAERNEMIDIVLGIIDRYREGEEE